MRFKNPPPPPPGTSGEMFYFRCLTRDLIFLHDVCAISAPVITLYVLSDVTDVVAWFVIDKYWKKEEKKKKKQKKE